MRPKGLPKTGGRQKGTPNRATSDLRRAVTEFLEANWYRVQEDLDTLDARDRLNFLEKLLSYSLPKLSAVTQETTLKSTLEQLTDDQLQEMALMVLNAHKNGQEGID